MNDPFEKYRAAKRWTLALDESGAFEGRLGPEGQDEPGGWVIGGVLLPGNGEESADSLAAFRRACATEPRVRWPVHAKDLSAETKLALSAAAAEVVAAQGGLWLFVVAQARGAGRGGDLGRYVRMFGATVDLAGRLVAALGGSELDAHPAQRSLPLSREVLAEATSRGVVMASPGATADAEPRGKAMLAAETRHALDALARESAGALGGWPQLTSVSVEVAARPEAHPGLALADLGCNRLYGGLWPDARPTMAELRTTLARAPFILVDLEALRHLRALDRSLREGPADLVAAAKVLTTLASNARALRPATDALACAAEGALAGATLLWERALARLAKDEGLAGLAVRTAASAEADLTLKRGAYEGTWLALEALWLGLGPLARAVQEAVRDRLLAARLWRLALECANHRGDVAAATRAAASFEALLGGGRSYRLLAEELLVRNLAVVAAQNQLPAEVAEVAAVSRALEVTNVGLERALAHAADVLSLVDSAASSPREPGSAPSPSADDQATEASDELRLWQALAGSPPVWAAPDRERGMGHGTVARTQGFLGQLDEARVSALRARALFADSPADRRLNASVIARLLLESARTGTLDEAGRQGLEAALGLAGARPFLAAGPLRASSAKLHELVLQVGARFSLDLALRALLWAPPPPKTTAPTVTPLLDLLRDEAMTARFSRGELRSHPTELLARHVGELLRRQPGGGPASARWFQLSLDLCDEAGDGTTLRRMGAFTRRLAAEPGFLAEGPPGSLLNPTFEYR